MTTNEEAKIAGGRAGLGEGEPKGFAFWPANARAAFYEAHAKGRHTRLVAQGEATIASSEPIIPQLAHLAPSLPRNSMHPPTFSASFRTRRPISPTSPLSSPVERGSPAALSFRSSDAP